MLLLVNVELCSFNTEYFEEKYEQYNISDETGVGKEELTMITQKLLDYLKGNREDILIFEEVNGEEEQIFGNRELMHLEDVKNLYQKGFLVKNISITILIIAISIITLYDRKKIQKTLNISATLSLGVMGLVGVLIYLDFYKYFIYFHKILFDNDLWLLNPQTDILIQMYPLEFFNGIGLKVVIMFIIELFLILLLSKLAPRIKRIEKSNK